MGLDYTPKTTSLPVVIVASLLTLKRGPTYNPTIATVSIYPTNNTIYSIVSLLRGEE
jgi:hypothetical protein